MFFFIGSIVVQLYLLVYTLKGLKENKNYRLLFFVVLLLMITVFGLYGFGGVELLLSSYGSMGLWSWLWSVFLGAIVFAFVALVFLIVIRVFITGKSVKETKKFIEDNINN